MEFGMYYGTLIYVVMEFHVGFYDYEEDDLTFPNSSEESELCAGQLGVGFCWVDSTKTPPSHTFHTHFPSALLSLLPFNFLRSLSFSFKRR